jgi:HSP20 family protein
MSQDSWDPFESMDSPLDEGFKPVPMMPRIRQPRLDMWEHNDQLVLQLEAPGFGPNEFEISIEGGRLHIMANHEEESEHHNPERNYFCHEISHQSFERWVQLPYAVKEEAVAHYEDGLLNIRLQELAPHQARQIKVKHGPKKPPPPEGPKKKPPGGPKK